MAVQTGSGGGGSPGLHDRREEGWGDRRARPQRSGGLGLDGRGAASPNRKRKVVSPAGLAAIFTLRLGSSVRGIIGVIGSMK